MEVDEAGTVAAAATGVQMVALSFQIPMEPQTFHADKPFMFIIRDTTTGINLFMGRFTDPDGENIDM